VTINILNYAELSELMFIICIYADKCKQL